MTNRMRMPELSSWKKAIIASMASALASGMFFFFVGKAEQAGQYTEKVDRTERKVEVLEVWRGEAEKDIAVLKDNVPSLIQATNDLRNAVEDLRRQVAIMNSKH